MLNVKVHDSTVKKRLNKCGLFERVSRRQPFLSKKNIDVQLKFVKFHFYKDSWINGLWTEETKVEMFDHNAQQHVWRKLNTHLRPTVKHSNGDFDHLERPGHLAVIESTMNSSVHLNILIKCEAICLTAKA